MTVVSPYHTYFSILDKLVWYNLLLKLQNVEWCYEEDGGNIMVPYPKSIAYNLETELSRGRTLLRCAGTNLSELCQIEFPSLINWTSPFRFKDCWMVFFIFIQT